MAVARLAVLGSPIQHSRSPQMHAAAYAVLGLDWSYERVEATGETLPAFVSALGPEWRGLSLTMPLKRAVLPLVDGHDALVDRLGLANTVVLGDRPALFNTDVEGIVRVLEPAGAHSAGTAVVLGAGATAASALAALQQLGVADRVVAARDPDAARGLPGAARVVPLSEVADELPSAGLVISTLPGYAGHVFEVPTLAGTPLLDVAYDPWPTPLGERWAAAGGRLLHGLDLLVEQAVLQVRAFVAGDPTVPLPAEQAVRRAMATAVGRSAA